MSRSKTPMQIFTFFVNNVLFHGVLHLKQQKKSVLPHIFFVMFLAIPRLLADGPWKKCPLWEADDGAKCRRWRSKVSQVCKKRRTRDALLLLGPICVAGGTKNADLRRFIEGPATWSDETCDVFIIFVP